MIADAKTKWTSAFSDRADGLVEMQDLFFFFFSLSR